MKTLALLGCTGSIGCNVCAVVRQFPERFRLASLAAGRNIKLLAEQVLEFTPDCISVAEEALIEPLAGLLPATYHKRIVCGREGLCAAATLPEADMVVSAVVGAAGLQPTLAAIRAGKDVGLANKETLVMAGRLIMAAVQQHGVRLLPIDSEHSAIFQALEAGRREDVSRLHLTASGGPFLSLSAAQLEQVSATDALAHPNWSMGRKISIDSATLMNKGLEVIEARWLFDMAPAHINVVVHPQSIVHSLVEYQDGSLVAQLGIPDMRIPIAYALTYPERLPLAMPRLNLASCGTLDFKEPDHARFPALRLAYSTLDEGGTRPAILNAANEVAVAAFLDGKIRFPQIAQVVAETLSQCGQGDELDLEAVVAADAEARRQASQLLPGFAR